MGNSANWPLMERIADETNGIATAVSNDDDIIGRILLAKSKITHEAMHSARFEIDGVRTYDVTPKEIGNLYRGEQLALFGHYARGGSARVTFTAKISGDEKTYVTDIEFPDVDTDNPEIERLWAYATIEDIMQTIHYEGEKSELKSAVVDMGTQYSLVTDYTSMIVVMPERFEELGIERNNKERISRERAAREERSSSGPRNYRVDRCRPMFNRSAPRIGGGALAMANAVDLANGKAASYQPVITDNRFYGWAALDATAGTDALYDAQGTATVNAGTDYLGNDATNLISS